MTYADGDQLIGQLGRVTTAIRGGRPGEVQLPLHGGSESFIAYGEGTIERGTQVLVVGTRPGRAVEVTALTD